VAVRVLAAVTAPAWLAYSLAEQRALDEWMLERWGPRFAAQRAQDFNQPCNSRSEGDREKAKRRTAPSTVRLS